MIPAIILAKGDSKRIPRKNMKLFCNEPLVYWTILQAQCSKLIDEVYVSTDSIEVEQVAKLMGAKVVKRPYALTLTPANQAVEHTMKFIEEEGKTIDCFLAPLPTSPIRLPWDMDNLISAYLMGNFPTACAVCEQLETIVYEQVGAGIRPKIFAKHNEYYCDGGGMSCNDPEWYKKLCAVIPKTDLEFDMSIVKNGFPYDSGYSVLKEWQTPELDLPEHWGVAESVMEKYILNPLGRDVYKNYKEQDHD